MHRFWSALLEPLLTSLHPRTIVEIGCERGRNTVNLLRFAKDHGSILHVVDPAPPEDLTQWQRDGGDHLVFHPAISLEAIPLIGPVDVVLIDGDHNWYTVYHELQLIKKVALDSGAAMPPVILHDVGWPYGRRDMYYEPDAIPDEFRQEYEKKGLKPGSSKLHEGGLNDQFFNAVFEGGPRNGVRTAIEDFVAENESSVHFIEIRAFNGLGIIWPRTSSSSHEEFRTQIEILLAAQPLLALLGDMESERIFRQYRFRSRIGELKSQNRTLKSRLSDKR